MQQSVDLSLWPDLLEDSFAFVSAVQLFASTDNLHELRHMLSHEKGVTEEEAEADIAHAMQTYATPQQAEDEPYLRPAVELFHFIKETAELASRIEVFATKFAETNQPAIVGTPS